MCRLAMDGETGQKWDRVVREAGRGFQQQGRGWPGVVVAVVARVVGGGGS